MNDDVLAALNDQINMELSSGYVYLSMSAQFAAESLDGFAHWMRLQASEELAHAMRLFDYANQRGGRVELHAVEKPDLDFGRPLEAFKRALEHERAVTASIHRLYGLAGERGDLATQRALDWFVNEQVEEEDSAQRAVDLLTRAGDNDAALLMLDRQFGARTGE